jgi:cytochrome c oxidase subunit 2
MVVPVGQTVRLLVTAADVIHAVALPAFGLKTDAVPGKVNETWFKAERTGVFYGQCSELCGVDHAFMPLQINVVTQAEFARWVASKGGSMTPPAVAAAGGTAAQVAAGTTGAPVVGQATTGPEAGGSTVPTAQTATTPTTTPAAAAAAPAQPAPAAAPAAQ